MEQQRSPVFRRLDAEGDDVKAPAPIDAHLVPARRQNLSRRAPTSDPEAVGAGQEVAESREESDEPAARQSRRIVSHGMVEDR